MVEPTFRAAPAARARRGIPRRPRKNRHPLSRVVPPLAAVAWLLAAPSCGPPPEAELFGAPAEQADAPPPSPEGFEVPPPPLSEGIFPCSDCHDPELPVDTGRRELAVHQEVVLHHAEADRWCLDCHDAADRDRLRLASGETIAFESSYRLCGQCHGDKYRDWRAGVHGRRTGQWNGAKQYLLCVHCHDSHAPAFGTLAPEPPPDRPERTP